MGSEALLFQRPPGECWCAPVGTGTVLVRKPTGIYWVEAKTLTGPSHVLLQIGPAYTDINGAYRGSGLVEEEEGNEGRSMSIE